MIVDLLVSSFWTANLVMAWFYLFKIVAAKWGAYLPGWAHAALAM